MNIKEMQAYALLHPTNGEFRSIEEAQCYSAIDAPYSYVLTVELMGVPDVDDKIGPVWHASASKMFKPIKDMSLTERFDLLRRCRLLLEGVGDTATEYIVPAERQIDIRLPLSDEDKRRLGQ